MALAPRLALPSLLVVLALGTAACGGSGESSAPAESTRTEGTTTESTVEVTAPAWATPYLSKPGPESALVLASSDFAAGDNRVAFLLVRDDGSTVDAPTLKVAYQPRDGAPVRTGVARLVPLGVPAADGDPAAVYVTELRGLAAGRRWVVVQPPGEALQGFQALRVAREPVAPAIGERAPASDNPTLATAPAKEITTARPPDVELLRHTVADSIADGVPFVVVFATPQFCQTRACGPTVDIVDATRKRLAGEEVRFIHIEIYEDNTPGKGPNRWVKEWELPSEPWVFVVDRGGVVRDRFEGAVAADELEASVRRVLRG
ncbi:MAG: hypothetical protein ACRC50_01215 [Gaiella sp.]